MKKIRELDRFQRGMLLLMAATLLIFAVLYGVLAGQTGWKYRGAFLRQSEENGTTIYTGKLDGQKLRIEVAEDWTVTFQWDGQTYGPYTAVEDVTAIPQDDAQADSMTGVEIRCGGEVFFRGGVVRNEDLWVLTNADGTDRDVFGTGTASVEPTATEILKLMDGRGKACRGSWWAWLFGLVLCALNVAEIFLAKPLFRRGVKVSVQDVADPKPTDVQVGAWHFGWVLFWLLAVGMMVIGLLYSYEVQL